MHRLFLLITIGLLTVLSSGSIHAQDSDAAPRLGGVEVTHGQIAVVGSDPTGGVFGMVVQRDGAGEVISIEAITYWSIDGTRLTVFIGPDGRPTEMMIGDVMVRYEDFTASRVDLLMVTTDTDTGDLVGERYNGVGYNPVTMRWALGYAQAVRSAPAQAYQDGVMVVSLPDAPLMLPPLQQPVSMEGRLSRRGLAFMLNAGAAWLGAATCVELAGVAFGSTPATGLLGAAAGFGMSLACGGTYIAVQGAYDQVEAMVSPPEAPEDSEVAERRANAALSTYMSNISDVTAYGLSSNPNAGSTGTSIGVSIASAFASDMADEYDRALALRDEYTLRLLDERIIDLVEYDMFQLPPPESTDPDGDGLRGGDDACPWRIGETDGFGCPIPKRGLYSARWAGEMCRDFPTQYRVVATGERIYVYTLPHDSVSGTYTTGDFESGLTSFIDEETAEYVGASDFRTQWWVASEGMIYVRVHPYDYEIEDLTTCTAVLSYSADMPYLDGAYQISIDGVYGDIIYDDYPMKRSFYFVYDDAGTLLGIITDPEDTLEDSVYVSEGGGMFDASTETTNRRLSLEGAGEVYYDSYYSERNNATGFGKIICDGAFYGSSSQIVPGDVPCVDEREPTAENYYTTGSDDDD